MSDQGIRPGTSQARSGARGRDRNGTHSSGRVRSACDVTVTALAEYPDSGTPAVLAALTQGGLAAATRSLAIEYACYGIRVNAVSAGIIQTPMLVPERCADLGDRLPPLGRPGQVSDVVNGVLFLESSPYITGEILHVDGGQIAGH